GLCSYCGKELENRFHIDHIKPAFHNHSEKPDRAGDDSEENLFPACPRCNRWKKTFTIEEFRNEIELQVTRLRQRSPGFQLAEDFHQIVTTTNRPMFFFEKKAEPGSGK
ncbi:MAG: HNH endonuclease, partial [Cyclobacteriaceae bacterium]|nr:HNH endonuclease [Cyclobacteriaceae bacterium]